MNIQEIIADLKMVSPIVLWIGICVVIVAFFNSYKDNNTPKSI